MNLHKGDHGLWMSCQHYSGFGCDRYEREHKLPSRWPGQRPHCVSAEVAKLVAVCNELPPHRGHPFIAVWDGNEWQTVGMVWDDGTIELKDMLRPDKYDMVRRGKRKSSYPSGYPSFDSIVQDDVPAKYI
jgi:hypothetical protein